MERNIDLIRDILIRMEKMGTREDFDYAFDGFNEEDVHYHIYLLNDAGFIEAINANSMQKDYYIPRTITWLGQDFLSDAKSDTVWNSMKTKLTVIGGSASLKVISALLIQIASKQLGLS
jgi:hypothetical protein